MPATRDLGGSTCSITVDEGEKMPDWGFPPSEVMENEKVSDQNETAKLYIHGLISEV